MSRIDPSGTLPGARIHPGHGAIRLIRVIRESRGNGRIEISARLRKDQTFAHLEAQSQALALARSIFPSGGPSPATGNSPRTWDMTATPLSAAFMDGGVSLNEQLIRSLRLAVGDSVQLQVARLVAGDIATMSISRIHADSVTVRVPQGVYRFAVSKDGDILGGIFPAQGWTIDRLPH